MHRSRWAVATVLVIALSLLSQAPAAAQPPDKPIDQGPSSSALPGADAPPPGFRSWAQLMRVQERLDAKAERILARRDDAYAGIVVSAEQRRLTVFWKGRPNTRAAAVIAEPDGDTAVVASARYSETELLAEADRIVRGGGVTAVAPNADGSGLTVALAPGAPPVRSTVPVTQTDTAAPQAASRGNDSSPYWGGARWNGCSNGFAIRIGGTTKMLSAGHCGANGNTARDGGGEVMGTVAGDSNAYDRLYINTTSAGRVYDGGVGTGEYSKPVIGASRSFVGDYICTSGAYSGARCNIRVVAVNQTINIGYPVYQTVRAEQLNRTNAIGQGDSGGPVFALASDTSKVIAKGTNTAIDLSTQVPCTGVPTSATRKCSWRFWYVDAVSSMAAYGATIVTG